MSRSPLYTQDLFDCRDVALVGGKAENLGRLLRAGFPVPDGFVITTRAYQAVHCGAGVPARTNSAEGPTNGNGSPPAGTDFVQAGKPAPQLLADLVDQIRAAYDAMGGGRVAVR